MLATSIPIAGKLRPWLSFGGVFSALKGIKTVGLSCLACLGLVSSVYMRFSFMQQQSLSADSCFSKLVNRTTVYKALPKP